MGEGEEVDNGANPRIELTHELDCTVKEEVDNGGNRTIELKRELDCAVKEEAELGASPPKKQVKLDPSETAMDDDGVSRWSELRENENVSSLETSTSLPIEMYGTGMLSSSNSSDNNQASSSADVTSESSGNSCLVSCSDERGARNRDHGGVSTSQISLEIPKHVSTTGIRKITFKFTKSKEEYERKLSTTPVPLGLSNGLQHEADSIIDSSDELGFGLDYSSSNRFLYNNMELKMSKKVVPDTYPNNVKKLLATGILEGARVKYISTSGDKEIAGEIRGSGYLCGCVACNYTNVLSAYEFEQHAGGSKTRHPNNHIFLENGRPIYSIIEGLKTAPLGILEELVKEMAGSSFNEGWKASHQQCDGMAPADKKHQRKSASMYPAHLRSSFSNSHSVLSHKKSGDSSGRKRDNDLHRLLFMPNGLPDGAKLAYYAKGQKVLEGYKHGNGIVCGHCSIEISPSQFEAHAGWAARRQPYRHIYTSNGLTLHDLAMSLARGQNLTTGSNDDMCTICGDRGELIPCGGCPRAYHQSCLGLPLVPDSDWCCSNCNERKADARDSSSNCKPIIFRLTRVVKTSEIESGGCVLCRENDFSVEKFDERTVIICDQCEKEYHVGCLRTAGCCDLKELPKDKWFCCNDCERIHCALRDLVLKGSEIISSSESIKISKKLLDKGLSPLADNDVHWHVLSGKCRHPEHLPLLSKAVSIFRECFSPITAMGGRDLIPVMVHGRNISGQEFGGMYCVLLTVKSVVVSAGLLRIFGREVAELPLVATSKEYQGKGYFLALFSLIEKLLHSLNVENLVLPAAEKAKSMWVNRFGFKDMGPERLCAYARELQLTEFKGTVMLEKKVEPPVDSS